MKNIGGQSAIPYEDEISIVRCLELCSDWGFPLSQMDIRIFTKMHLDKNGMSIPQFKNGNLPGKEWCYSFLNRHKTRLTMRISQNISANRSSVSRADVQAYFDNLIHFVTGIPACNIFNFDETAMVDDPEKKTHFPARCKIS